MMQTAFQKGLSRDLSVRFWGAPEPKSSALQQLNHPIDQLNQVLNAMSAEQRPAASRHRELEEARTFQRRSEKKGIVGRLFKMGLTLSAAVLGIGTAGYGVMNTTQYVQTLPQGEAAQKEAEMKKLDKHIGSSYRDLNKWLSKTQNASEQYTVGTAEQIEFQQHAKRFVDSLITSLKESERPEDQALAAKLQLKSHERETQIDKLGLKLFSHVEAQKKAEKSLDLLPLVQQDPAFKHLSEREKERFAMDAYALLNKKASLDMSQFQLSEVQPQRDRGSQASRTAERDFRDMLDAYVGNPVQGLSLDRLKSLQNQTEVQQMMSEVIQNNFAHLEPQDLALFKSRTTDMLQVIDYPLHQSTWWLLLYGALSAAGGAATLGMATHSIQRLRKSLKPREAGDVSLKVIHPEENQIELRGQLKQQLSDFASQLAERRIQLATKIPEWKGLLLNGKRPQELASHLEKCLLNEAHQALIQKGGNLEVGEITLLQKAVSLMNTHQANNQHFVDFTLGDKPLPVAKLDANKPLLSRVFLKTNEDIQQLKVTLEEEEMGQTLALLNHQLKASETLKEFEAQAVLVGLLKGERSLNKGDQKKTEGKALAIEEKRLLVLSNSVKDDEALLVAGLRYLEELTSKRLQCEVALVETGTAGDAKTLQAKLDQLQQLERTRRDLATNSVYDDLAQRVNEARVRMQVVQEGLQKSN